MNAGVGSLLDLARLRYFVAVAEERHFGRAAQSLHVSQPVLSRQIQKLERELGAPLLTRSSRNVELTSLGHEVLQEARSLLATEEATRRRLERIVGGLATLSVGFWPTDPLGSCLRRFSEIQPDASVELMRIYWHNQTHIIRDGRADVAFIHGPVSEQALTFMEIRSEPRLVAMPADHLLATRSDVSITELADEPVLVYSGADPEWNAFGHVDPRPDGHQPVLGPVVHNVEEGLQHIAAGHAIGLPPRSAVSLGSTADLAFVPVNDIPPLQIRLAWNPDHRSPLVPDFAEAVRATTPHE